MTRGLRLTEAQFRELWRKDTPAEKKKLEPKHDYARDLAEQIVAARLPIPVLEYAFDAQLEGSGRSWRMDLCWPELKLGVEVDGAVHRIKERFKADIPKHQAAFKLGYLVLRVSPAQVRSGEALRFVREALMSSASISPG